MRLALLLSIISWCANAQRFIVHQNISKDIASILYSNKEELINRLSGLSCDSIIFFSENNTIIIAPRCKVNFASLKDTTEMGLFAAKYVKSFKAAIPSAIYSTIAMWKSILAIQSQNQYLRKCLYKIVLKDGKNTITFFAEDGHGLFSIINFKYKGKRYETECAYNPAGMFAIKNSKNVDGTMNINSMLIEMLKFD